MDTEQSNHDMEQASLGKLLAEQNFINAQRAHVNKKVEWYVTTLIIMGAGTFAAVFMAIGKHLI